MVGDKTLRKQLIRLAYEKPELRDHVLPLVASHKEAAGDPKSPAVALGRASADIVMAVAKEVVKLLKQEGDFASIKIEPPSRDAPYRASASVDFKVEYTDERPPQGGWISISHGLSAGDRNPNVSSEAYFLGKQKVLQSEATVSWENGPKHLSKMMPKIIVDRFFAIYSG